MENFLKIPGLRHLAEDIFLNLNNNDLQICELINKSTKDILTNPLFWLKKFIRRGLSKKNQDDWHNAIRLTKNTNLEGNILLYLKNCSRHGIWNPCKQWQWHQQHDGFIISQHSNYCHGKSQMYHNLLLNNNRRRRYW